MKAVKDLASPDSCPPGPEPQSTMWFQLAIIYIVERNLERSSVIAGLLSITDTTIIGTVRRLTPGIQEYSNSLPPGGVSVAAGPPQNSMNRNEGGVRITMGTHHGIYI